jgi:hypothetical protein
MDHWKEELAEQGLDEIELDLAKPDFGNGFYWCDEYQECGESGQGDCGRQCAAYKPRNGKNGRCIHSVHTYEGTGKFFVLTKNGLKPIKGDKK